MADDKKDEKSGKTLSLSGKKTLSLKGGAGGGQVRQSFSGGRSKPVAVEVRRKRDGTAQPSTRGGAQANPQAGLSKEELERRARVLENAKKSAPPRREAPSTGRKIEDKVNRRYEGDAPVKKPIVVDEIPLPPSEESRRRDAVQRIAQTQTRRKDDEVDDENVSVRERMKRAETRKTKKTRQDDVAAPLTVTQALNRDYERDRGPSLAAQRRAREKERMKAQNTQAEAVKQVRDVIIPETITVQELANRMAERAVNVIKSLMKMGVMATASQTIDADTAELVVEEFGHRFKRVTEADVEDNMFGGDDAAEDMKPRPPVVTIMGHVDHGKTSLLDAMRATNVVDGEAGGITQHIGAYQIETKDGNKITFLDTPGHAAFTQMRARGADITDIVILVVAANDSIKPQTIEAISHAKAAEVPMIVAINKIDLPEANPLKVKQDLLQHEVIVEDMGGEVLCVEISAKNKQNLEALVEAIQLQSELLDLQANPDRKAQGTVIESKLETGRGSVATILISRGTLKKGDIFVSGAETGRIRAILDDQSRQLDEAIPGQPVEILGLNGTPDAGDDFVVVDSDAQAREVTEFRQRRKRDLGSVAAKAASMDQLFAQAQQQDSVKELNLIIKADVHGSAEALIGSMAKIQEENENVSVKVIHSGAGGITETDVTLAQSTGALIIGFNVRANAQAKRLAEQEKVDIRTYSIIYNAIDDVKAILGGLLEPTIREEYIGNADIKEIFNITKVGKIAGCTVTMGFVKRGSKVRLLRDDVVIHEGKLKTLKRFKDEVPEVKEGTECGMAFENYDDIKVGDVIECFDLIEETQEIA